jgi:hypothetical protein
LDVDVDVVVPKTTIFNPTNKGGKNTRFLFRGFKGSNSIKLIIEEVHDQAASDVYPFIVC